MRVFALNQALLQRFVARFEALHFDGDFRVRARRRRHFDVGTVDQIGIFQPDRPVLDDLQFGTREPDVAVAFDDLLFLLRSNRLGLRQPIAHRLQFALQRSDALFAIA